MLTSLLAAMAAGALLTVIVQLAAALVLMVSVPTPTAGRHHVAVARRAPVAAGPVYSGRHRAVLIGG